MGTSIQLVEVTLVTRLLNIDCSQRTIHLNLNAIMHNTNTVTWFAKSVNRRLRISEIVRKLWPSKCQLIRNEKQLNNTSTTSDKQSRRLEHPNPNPNVEKITKYKTCAQYPWLDRGSKVEIRSSYWNGAFSIEISKSLRSDQSNSGISDSVDKSDGDNINRYPNTTCAVLKIFMFTEIKIFEHFESSWRQFVSNGTGCSNKLKKHYVILWN